MTSPRKLPGKFHAVRQFVDPVGADKSSVFETKVVKRILTICGLTSLRGEICDRNKELTGESRLTLPAFHEVVLDFPFRVTSRYVTNLDKHFSINKCFKGKFTAQKPYKVLQEAITEWEEEGGSSEPLALVMNWPYVEHGVVIHSRGDTGYDGFRLLFRSGRELVCIESFDPFLHTLNSLWHGRS
jgi:hypothetical protein